VTVSSDEEWARIKGEANLKLRDQKRKLEAGERAQEGSGPLQCLPIQRYREHYLKNAPDRDLAVCKILMFTSKSAEHLEPFSPEELYHCGHCALLGAAPQSLLQILSLKS